MNELIQQARELWAENYSTEYVATKSRTLVPQLCEALEEQEKMHRISVNAGADAIRQLKTRAEKAEAERDKLAEFIRWTDNNFNRYMPTEYVQRLRELVDNLPEPPKGE